MRFDFEMMFCVVTGFVENGMSVWGFEVMSNECGH